MENYTCKKGCIISVIISIIIAVGFGLAFSNGLILLPLNFVKIALAVFAISITIFVGILYIANFFVRDCNIFKRCICNIGICFLVPIIGTLIAGTITAIIELAITSIAAILAISFTMFFFIWMVISLIRLIKCLIINICN